MPRRSRGWSWAAASVGLLCFAAAAWISTTYFVVSDTACVMFRPSAWTEVCRPTMVRWTVAVAVLVACGLAAAIAGCKLAYDQRRRSN